MCSGFDWLFVVFVLDMVVLCGWLWVGLGFWVWICGLLMWCGVMVEFASVGGFLG